MNLETVYSGLQFPEGPIALPDGSVLLVEIGAACLSRITPDGVREVVAETGGGPNGAAIGPDGAVYICNNGGARFHREPGHIRVLGQAEDYSGGRIERVDLATKRCTTLYTHCNGHELRGPNDIVFDRQGGFYFTDLGKTRLRDRDRGGVYYALPDGSHISEICYPLSQPNGIGLSPAEDMLYVAETETGRLWRWPIVSSGKLDRLPYPSLSSGMLVHNGGGERRFDSLAVEQSGRICVATLGDGGITSVMPDGSEPEFLPMPDRHTTNICFGGTDLKTAFITLSSSGRLVRCCWPQAGLPLNFVGQSLMHNPGP